MSDAPIEWLPLGDLPLAIRRNCSRINATPGNLMMGLLATMDTIVLPPESIQKVLVVSSFEDHDPLKNVLVRAFYAIKHRWIGKVDLRFVRVKSRDAFIEAMNENDAAIMIFDGHGSDNSVEPIGTIMISAQKIDVWDLRGQVRVPPIVILSACDTHGVDGSTHATVGNGFLALGAQTVLATLLPIGGPEAAMFVARFVYRLADFVPAALNSKWRVLSWTEIVSGMLRMFLASELLDQMVGEPGPMESARGRMQSLTNLDINTGNEEWYERLLSRIAEYRDEDAATVSAQMKRIVARPEAIRYVQLGNPENILIDDGRVREAVLAEYGVKDG